MLSLCWSLVRTIKCILQRQQLGFLPLAIAIFRFQVETGFAIDSIQFLRCISISTSRSSSISKRMEIAWPTNRLTRKYSWQTRWMRWKGRKKLDLVRIVESDVLFPVFFFFFVLFETFFELLLIVDYKSIRNGIDMRAERKKKKPANCPEVWPVCFAKMAW